MHKCFATNFSLITIAKMLLLQKYRRKRRAWNIKLQLHLEKKKIRAHTWVSWYQTTRMIFFLIFRSCFIWWIFKLSFITLMVSNFMVFITVIRITIWIFSIITVNFIMLQQTFCRIISCTSIPNIRFAVWIVLKLSKSVYVIYACTHLYMYLK